MQLHLYLPGDPSSAESAAAVDLGAAVTAYDGAQPVRVDVRRLPYGRPTPTSTDGPFDRSIVIRENGTAATELHPTNPNSATTTSAVDRSPVTRARVPGSRLRGTRNLRCATVVR
ncbi:MAG: hypothetical protein EOP32_01525 [Rhodococcus sp. (in: high G+C Gram-positive bacteria)]|nr:MAG: hypothetical protein EOP32_01525 [Rhodococcus sp. (in: high G+C Gram-positive bacteria)]